MILSSLFYIVLYLISVPLSLKSLKHLGLVTVDKKTLEWLVLVPFINSALSLGYLITICVDEMADLRNFIQTHKKALEDKRAARPAEHSSRGDRIT